MGNRSGKFYRKNEAEVMRMLGLEPTPNSGSGWIVKEDGQSEDVICQLKSTDASRISIQKQDLDKLEYNATVVHKLPVFAVQFLKSDDTYLVMRPEYLKELASYLETGKVPDFDLGIDIIDEPVKRKKTKTIKSSSNARKQFMEEHEKQFKKKERKAT